MAEPVEIQIARLEENVKALAQKVDANATLARETAERARIHETDVSDKLGALISMTDEWRGVRKTLSAFGALLLGVGTIAGAFLHYLWQKGL